MRRRALLSGLGLGLTGAFAGCSSYIFRDWETRTEQRTFETRPGTPLRVETWNGDVSVRSHDEPEIAVTATFKARTDGAVDDLSVRGIERGGHFVLEPRGFTDPDEVGLGLSIDLPSSMSLVGVQTTTGNIEVTGVSGGGRIEAETGDIDLIDLDSAHAWTTNGDVSIRNVDAVGGARSTTGDVTAEIPSPLPEDIVVSTETGDVKASLSPEIDAEIVARTDTGEVTYQGPPLSGSTIAEDRVSGTVGAGSHSLRAETETGDVTILTL